MADRPTRINAGDTAVWTEATSTATSVTYYFQDANGDSIFSVAAVIVTGTGTFTLDGDETAGEAPGTYTAYRSAVTAGARESEHKGELVLAPNVDGSSPKTQAQTNVGLLEAHIAGRLAAGLEGHTIDGQTIQKISISDARVMLLKYKAERDAELAAFNGNAGNSNRILHRFK